MGQRIFSVQAARRVARLGTAHLLWVSARQAILFREPGWEPLMPPRNGGVLFLNRQAQQVAGKTTSKSGAKTMTIWQIAE
jgi:hypothetical protein